MSYRRLVGAVSWPTWTKPGIAIVAGQEHIEDNSVGKRHIYILGEEQDHEVESLYDKCLSLQSEHGPEFWLVNLNNQLIAIFEQLNSKGKKRYKRTISLQLPPEVNQPGALEMYAQILRRRLKKEQKSLFFGNSSFIASEIMDLHREEITKENTIDEYPALAALGFILGELDLRDRPKPKPFKRKRSRKAKVI